MYPFRVMAFFELPTALLSGGLRAGAVDFLDKPFSDEGRLRVVQSALRSSRRGGEGVHRCDSRLRRMRRGVWRRADVALCPDWGVIALWKPRQVAR